MSTKEEESTEKKGGCRIAEILQYTCLVKTSRTNMPPRTVCYPIPRILKLYVILNVSFCIDPNLSLPLAVLVVLRLRSPSLLNWTQRQEKLEFLPTSGA